MTVQMSVYLQYVFFMFNYFIYLDIKSDGLFHRQNFKDLNRKIKVFFYAEHSYLDLAQSLLHKNDSSQNRIICTTK